ncbi:MAG: hypothetical protein V1696_03290 [Candidatus Jorgensenbacteria bacterium]
MKNVLSIGSVEELRSLSLVEDVGHMLFGEAEVGHVLKLCDALWLHSGNPTDPHAELTSGKCSNGFVDVLRALRYTNLCEIFADQLLVRVKAKMTRVDFGGPIDWVIGSDHAGAALSHSVATLLKAQHDFTEKGPDKTQLWKRFTIEPGETVLQVEELMTTSGTLLAVRKGIREGNAKRPVSFTPFVATLVHRSDVYDIEGTPVAYLVHYDIDTWEPAECPLCAAGSERLRPKEGKNWAKLTGKTA